MVHTSNLSLLVEFWVFDAHSIESSLNAPDVTNTIRSFESFGTFERSSIAPLSENGMVHVMELKLHYQAGSSWRLCMWQALI
jgi:hypothetical protein